ncbi:phosphoribosylamine--glycine ligase [Clostridium thermosuccinogenes]|uniref:Phosphoribosylamine--glycine ligase n=1 Tax=Clostridium thermosuccinogenes TaxID=84032 RepID=A0A2K2FDT4_9CLOT|nr:phosphoribosylamine--glycine ligase [Pseudoclostridium thermosuccinogenes]AUS97552.1 phosphoribosylamine--glycine ligase [Pseudoclostridium thermosuccinogenes]PNT96925.1 phosphoribosylamine--glycine ligase [Pseudoclostridium thermosuccinogenes]PNT98808.1 phosphoribosylamine--glycine ligase [Pseudoclostridium thermosuccinogenes]
MKILVVGSGGREHALVWKIAQSPLVDKIYCAPGNGGIASIAECVPIKAMDIEKIVQFSLDKSLDMVVVAPDDPLAAGMVDALEEAGIRAFGPTKKAAIIEGSKSFSKALMKKYGIPTAEYEVFDNSRDAVEYLKNSKYPIVVKADGLALGKGVVIAQNFEEARDAVNSIMEEKIFGASGDKVVIEEFLTGQEVSVLSFTDGKTVVPMVSSQDHKRALDNDQGPNTGGMGTFSPSRIYTPEIAEYCMEKIYKPTIEAMSKEGRKFKGVLYFGLILTSDGPKVLEYNARFGDPETQVVLPRLKTDIVEIFNAVIDEELDSIKIEWEDNAAVCVIMASGGYPGKYATGYEITGIQNAESDGDIVVFHAGTKKENGAYFTAGGRVLGVTATAGSLDEAIKKAYQGVGRISFKDMHFRKDIGLK